MIKINLYPTKPIKKKERAGVVDILVFVLVLAVCGAVIWIVNGSISEKVDTQSRTNNVKKMKIDSIRQEIKDHDMIKRQLQEIEAREKIIQELIAARTGPVQMLVELSNILSLGKGPSIKPDEYKEMLQQAPSSGFNPEWDPRRLWLKQFEEEDRVVAVHGEAMSNEDVGEFLRRMKISKYFFNEELVKTKQEKAEGSSAMIVAFEIKCNIRYR
ncbi:MAG: PilN domain-containing protein [Pseudomonadota bacterium]